MKQLKFRVWTGIEMTNDVTVGRFGNFYVNPGAKGDGLDPNDSASLTPFTTKYHETTPVMQFTTLTDKNGKEIWEGDRVKTHGSETGFIYEVKWKDGRWILFNDGLGEFDLYEENLSIY